MPASILASLLGAWIAQRADASNLRLGFGIFLIYAATRMLAPKLFRLTLRRLGGSQA
jgi:uncharacterized membrane protein YfcA